MKRTTVLLAEDHMVVREGFRNLLERETDFHVVGEAKTGRQAVALARKLRPDVVVMDIAMPRLNGLEATLRIRREVPSVKVLILSAHGDDAYIDRAMELGAAGFLIKQTSSHELSRAIREVQKGRTFFSPAVAGRFRDAKPAAEGGRVRKGVPRLSPREREVLQRIAEGSLNKQVAPELGISIKTVEKHRQSLMKKLNVHDVAGLTRYAIGAGIIESSVQVTIR